MSKQKFDKALIKINSLDNVAIVTFENGIKKGTKIDEDLIAQQDILNRS